MLQDRINKRFAANNLIIERRSQIPGNIVVNSTAIPAVTPKMRKTKMIFIR